MKMRQTYIDGTKLVLCDPNNFRNVLTVTNTRSPKKAGDMSVFNVRSEFKFVTLASVPVPTGVEPSSAPNEVISTTVTISGSVDNKVAVLAQVDLLISWLNSAKSDLTAGFLPSETEFLLPLSE